MQPTHQMELFVITMDDGITHSYFSYVSWAKDNSSTVGTANLIMPFDNKMLSYWTQYDGVVIISAKLKNNKLNTNSKEYYKKITEDIQKREANKRKLTKAIKDTTKYDKILKLFKQKVNNDEYNFSFIGKKAKAKKQGNQIVLILEDIGWKFTQYVPKDFREKYIAGQKLDDAFQAICEFLGVEFAYSLDGLSEYTFASDGYSVQKDGKTIEVVPDMLKTIDEPETIDSAVSNIRLTLENQSFDELNRKQIQARNREDNPNERSIASTAINTSMQMSENMRNLLVNSQQEKRDKYEDLFNSRIKDLFIGNAYYDSNLTDTNFNYDSITVKPSSIGIANQVQDLLTPQSQGIQQMSVSSEMAQNFTNIEAATRNTINQVRQRRG